MNLIPISFVMLPVIADAGLALLARDWRAPVMKIGLAVGAVLLASSVPLGTFRRLMPLATGAGIAGIVLLPLTIWRPTAPLGLRVAMGVVPAMAAHLTFLLYAMAQR